MVLYFTSLFIDWFSPVFFIPTIPSWFNSFSWFVSLIIFRLYINIIISLLLSKVNQINLPFCPAYYNNNNNNNNYNSTLEEFLDCCQLAQGELSMKCLVSILSIWRTLNTKMVKSQSTPIFLCCDIFRSSECRTKSHSISKWYNPY